MKTGNDFFNNRPTFVGGTFSPPLRKKDTLSDLRKDEEFNEVTQRFLQSIGEGDSVRDLFAYFRGADFNLAEGLSVLADSKKFTTQQKKDYQYLRNRFDNASMGGLGEWVSGIANITGDVITDPTMIASLMFVPWTGGASAATRLAASKAVQTTLKKLTNKEIAEATAKGVAKLPGQKLKTPLSKTAQTALASTEGFLYGSTLNAVKQNTDINTDRRTNYSLGETLAVGALGAAIPVAVRGVGVGARRTYDKFNSSIQQQRANRIDGGDDYKVGVLDKGIELLDTVADNVVSPAVRHSRFITQFFEKPTSRFVEKMKADKGLDKLIKLFRYDTDRSMSAKGFDAKMPVSERSYYELVNMDIGENQQILDDLLEPLYNKGKITTPAFGSRDAFFKIPFKKRIFGKDEEATRKSIFNYQRIDDETNSALAYYLRSGRKTIDIDGKRVSIIDAFNVTENTLDDIVKAGDGVAELMKKIRRQAVAQGLNVGRVKNYLSRGWRYNRVKDERENFVENGIEGKLIKEIKRKYPKLRKKENESDLIALLDEIGDPNSAAGRSWVELATIGKGRILQRGFFKSTPSLSKERKLGLLDEIEISDYLDDNVAGLVSNYIHQAAGYIRRTELFGEDLADFTQRYINPIQQRLRKQGKELTKSEFKQLEDLYLISTGQISQPNSTLARIGNDIAIVGNQLALLPFATVTSLSEIAVPLVKGAGKVGIQKAGPDEPKIAQGGIRTLWETADEYRRMWWNDTWTKELKDARPESMRELNRFNRAMNLASGDRAVAMFGQGFGPRATKAQNVFFKFNLLHDWTRFVQLTSFNVGKSKIYDNLFELATDKSLAQPLKKLSKKRKIRLENELKELGVDVAAGIRWVKSGSKNSAKFYEESLLPSAARYVDEVIMNPTAAANQKPLFHNMPSTRWAFGLLGFPTAFSNTVLKNAVREISKDVRQKEVRKIGEIAAGVTTMVGIGMFGNTIRSRGQNLERIEEGETTLASEIKDAAIRAGLVGPTEYALRVQQTTEYDNLIKSLLGRFTGPAVNDILNLLEDWNGPMSVFIDKIPGIAAFRSLNPEGYKELKSLARKTDKAAGTTARGRKKKEEEPKPLTPLFSTGGLVKGQEEVPFTKEDPADRINPYTQETYSGKTLDDLFLDEESERLGFQKGTPEKIYADDYDFKNKEGFVTYKYADGSQFEVYDEPPVKEVVPVIELLVGGAPKVIAGLGEAGFDLVRNLTRNSTKVNKPMNYYHGSTKKLDKLIPPADRVSNKDIEDLYQAGTYLGKPNERGFRIASMYAKDKGFVNVVDEKQFNKIAGNLFNPRNIPEDVMKKFAGAVANRQQAIKLATTQREKAKIRKEIVDLENLFKPSTSGYISRINTKQRDFLQNLGYDGVDVSDDVAVAFSKLKVKKAVDSKFLQRLRDRQERQEGF